MTLTNVLIFRISCSLLEVRFFTTSIISNSTVPSVPVIRKLKKCYTQVSQTVLFRFLILVYIIIISSNLDIISAKFSLNVCKGLLYKLKEPISYIDISMYK